MFEDQILNTLPLPQLAHVDSTLAHIDRREVDLRVIEHARETYDDAADATSNRPAQDPVAQPR